MRPSTEVEKKLAKAIKERDEAKAALTNLQAFTSKLSERTCRIIINCKCGAWVID